MTRALVLAFALAACAKDVEELEPYPCPQNDVRCAYGHACVAGQCVMPFIGAPCNLYVDCSLAAPDAVCLGGDCDFNVFPFTCLIGICVEPCGAGCPPGAVCAPDVDACVPTCDGGCPRGSTCHPLPGGGMGCYPEGTYDVCDGVEVTASCARCGASFWPVDCGDGTSCAEHSTCDTANGYCQCDTGLYAYHCDDTSCSDTNPCLFPDWYCRPPEATRTPGCGDPTFLTAGVCHCHDGRAVPFDCGENVSCDARCVPG